MKLELQVKVDCVFSIFFIVLVRFARNNMEKLEKKKDLKILQVPVNAIKLVFLDIV